MKCMRKCFCVLPSVFPPTQSFVIPSAFLFLLRPDLGVKVYGSREGRIDD
jgi:hypothetical protein